MMALKTKHRKWLTKNKSGLASSKKKDKSNTVSEQRAEESQSLNGTLQKRTCSNTRYITFIRVYTTKEYHRVGGEQAWNDILDEMSSMLKTENSDKMFDLQKQIFYNQWRLKVVEIVMSEGGLRDMWKPMIANSLVEAGFDYVENLEDDKKYQRQIDMVMNEASSVVVKLNQLYVQYNALAPTTEEGAQSKKEINFDEELAILSKQGYRVNKRRQSITEYCAAVNALFEDVQRQKKQHNKK